MLDGHLQEAFAAAGAPAGVALCALGSYGRRELCPGSDVDVLLVHDRAGARARVDDLAEALWYPLWDAGFVLGHAIRTTKEAVALADADLDTLTALLDARPVAGGAAVVADLVRRVRALVPRRRRRLVGQLGDAAALRMLRPGPIAEMLEPNLKDGGGGLRDIQSLAWIGWAVGEPGGVDTLVARGFLQPADPRLLADATSLLLDVRVALHRVTQRGADVLALQDQDAVAAALGASDADELVRRLATRSRAVAWVAADAWDRLRAAERGPSGRVAHADREVAVGVVLRDGRVAADGDGPVDARLVLRVAVAAATRAAPIDRHTLRRLASMSSPASPAWAPDERDAFAALLRAGRRSVPVFEALDHVGVLTRLLPEWEHVRSLPQRNAYHRFTVDRHLLETVSECAALLDGPAGDTFEDTVGRECGQPDLLLLAGLLHDMAKGRGGDHSTIGAATAREVAGRLGHPDGALDTLAWLVANHLLLAETATRRDLSDDAIVSRVANVAGDAERLRLLYLLTIADSRATGPAAWNSSKAALVRELYVKARAVLVGEDAGDEDARRAEIEQRLGAVHAAAFLGALPRAYLGAFTPDEIAEHAELFGRPGDVVEWEVLEHGMLRATIVTDDRPGLLATVAASLTLMGLDVAEALAFSRDGRALEVFTGTDRFDRLGDGDGRAVATRRLQDALRDDTGLAEALEHNVDRYRHRREPEPVSIAFDLDASAGATVVEVHARDEIGLLARVARVITNAGFDVRIAKVATMAERVVDVFYVCEPDGTKPLGGARLDGLRRAISGQVH